MQQIGYIKQSHQELSSDFEFWQSVRKIQNNIDFKSHNSFL